MTEAIDRYDYLELYGLIERIVRNHQQWLMGKSVVETSLITEAETILEENEEKATRLRRHSSSK